jgi:DNA-binding GntR family transcriptional regulator
VSDLAAPDEELAYRRVADDVASRISSGELTPGTRLRSEQDLAEYYEVARGTIRRAMAVLRERRLIETIHGRGTFVRSQP